MSAFFFFCVSILAVLIVSAFVIAFIWSGVADGAQSAFGENNPIDDVAADIRRRVKSGELHL